VYYRHCTEQPQRVRRLVDFMIEQPSASRDSPSTTRTQDMVAVGIRHKF
jgi:predicted porin